MAVRLERTGGQGLAAGLHFEVIVGVRTQIGDCQVIVRNAGIIPAPAVILPQAGGDIVTGGSGLPTDRILLGLVVLAGSRRSISFVQDMGILVVALRIGYLSQELLHDGIRDQNVIPVFYLGIQIIFFARCRIDGRGINILLVLFVVVVVILRLGAAEHQRNENNQR